MSSPAVDFSKLYTQKDFDQFLHAEAGKTVLPMLYRVYDNSSKKRNGYLLGVVDLAWFRYPRTSVDDFFHPASRVQQCFREANPFVVEYDVRKVWSMDCLKKVCKVFQSIECELLVEAAEKEKAIYDLESLEDHKKGDDLFFRHLPNFECWSMLGESFAKGSEELIAEYVRKCYAPPVRKHYAQQNPKLADNIVRNFRDKGGMPFYVIDATRLPTVGPVEEGVCELLRQKGFTVERIQEKQ